MTLLHLRQTDRMVEGNRKAQGGTTLSGKLFVGTGTKKIKSLEKGKKSREKPEQQREIKPTV